MTILWSYRTLGVKDHQSRPFIFQIFKKFSRNIKDRMLVMDKHNITPLMSCVHEPGVYLKIKPLDVGTPMLKIESEVRAVEHNPST